MQTENKSSNRINDLFSNRKKNVLSVYLTAGYPALEDTVSILGALQEGGADMVEIGMPFSDPLADGKVIQESSQVALRNGMSLKKLFSQLKGIRERIHIPLILMGYLNPVLQYGMENFLSSCKECGIDGLILPDLPMREYEEKYRDLFIKYGVLLILLVTPQTPEERVREIAGISGGFLYLVSASSTTGKKASFSDEQISYFRRIKEMNLDIPGMIGFGISDREGFLQACEWAEGAIIGSAFIKALEGSDNPVVQTQKFLLDIRGREEAD